MSKTLSQSPASNTEDKTQSLYREWRKGFVTPLLVGSLVFGLLALIPAILASKSNLISVIFIGIYVLTGLVAVLPLPYNLRMGTFLLLVYILGLSELATHGILGDSVFFFLGLIILATMLLSPRAGMISIAGTLLTFAVFGWLIMSGDFLLINPDASPASIQDWLSASAAMLMFGIVIIIGFLRLETQFSIVQNQVDSTLTQLTDERNNLENKVRDRTSQLKKVNEIGRIVTSILDPEELRSSAVFLIGNEFDCYFTAIYFVDTTGHWAEIKEATGDAGKLLRENKHRLDLNGKSGIATAIRNREIWIALDHGSGSIKFDNPLLPYTRSQVVMPLIAGDKVIGALELHSTRDSAFSDQDIATFSSMANQVAIAIENSRLYQESQQSLSEMRATQRQYLEGAWSSLMSEKTLEYELGDDETGDRFIDVPLTLRDQIIGQINMSGNDEWTPEQRNLIESIATQASLALENARLVEESQSVAMREKLANEIISKIWSSTNIDTILQTAVRELGRALEAAEVEIELGMGVKK